MTSVENKRYISDIISLNDIDNWHNGETVLISAGCGAGKSYFIKNILYAKALQQNKKILMLIHRTNCVNQFQMEIEKDNKTDVIDIKTYQSVEARIIKNGSYSFSDYYYIVSDEFHYFVEDSGFNCYTDISFNAIMCCNTAVKIFMSATGDNLKTIIDKRIGKKKIPMHSYYLPTDYSHLKSLTFYYDDAHTERLADYFLKNKEKAIFFLDSAQEANKLYHKYKSFSLFLCGTSSSSKYGDDMDIPLINEMLQNERFEKQFLFCTTCFDAGANIIDLNLHNVVLKVKNISSLIQCLGRKRSQGKDDYLNVYIHSLPNKIINGMRSVRLTALQKADYLLQNNTQAFLNKYPRDNRNSALIYDDPMSARNKNTCTKKVNMMIYNKYNLDISLFTQMFEVGGYIGYVADLLHFGNGYTKNYIVWNKVELKQYLEFLVTSKKVFLTRADRKLLIAKIDVTSNGRSLKSLDSLNAALKENKFNYRIESFETSRIVDGVKKNYKSAWKVIKLDETK